MALFDFFKRTKKVSDSIEIKSTQDLVFFDSTGRVIGNGSKGYKHITNGSARPSFFEITNDAYGNSPWVYIIVDRIAKACMSVDLQLLNMNNEPISRQMARVGRVRELENLLMNPQQGFNEYSFKKLLYSTVSNYLLTGNGYMMGLPYNTPEPQRYTDLIVPLSQNINPNDNGLANLIFYDVNYFGLSFTPKPQYVLQMSLPNLTQDKFEGYSSMQSLSNIWKANNALNSNEQFTHERKGANGIVYSEGNRPLTSTERKAMQSQMDEDVSSRGRVGRYTYYPQKIGYIDLAKSFRDLQSNESKGAHRETIAAAYNYPVQLLNDTSSTTDNNMAQAEKMAFKKAILPVLDFFLKELNKWLIRDNFGLQTVKLGYIVEDIPEMNLINADKTDNNIKRLDMVVKVNDSIRNGSMTNQIGVNTLIIAGGFTEEEAKELVIKDIKNEPTQQTE